MSKPDQELFVDRLVNNYASAGLNRIDLAMLYYAEKLTRTPCEITVHDIAALRAEGFDDRSVHDICAITAYYAFVNRIADGLGVELEPVKQKR